MSEEEATAIVEIARDLLTMVEEAYDSEPLAWVLAQLENPEKLGIVARKGTWFPGKPTREVLQ